MDKGEKVSSASSNVACITPKYYGEITLAVPGAQANNKQWLLADYLAACVDADKCEDPADAAYADSDDQHGAADPGPLYIEFAGAGKPPAFVTGKNSGIADVAYLEEGFADSQLVGFEAPTMKLDDDGATPVFNTGGFSIAGESISIRKNHLYIVAVADSDDDSPTKFHYHWLWVSSDVPSGVAGEITVQVLMSKDAM
jgi:hypothetical protein